MLTGLLIAWGAYIRNPRFPAAFVAQFGAIYQFIYNKWYFDELYNAIFVGSIYALFAVGFALVFSVLDILNLAHPVVFMLGAFVEWVGPVNALLPGVLASIIIFGYGTLATGIYGWPIYLSPAFDGASAN